MRLIDLTALFDLSACACLHVCIGPQKSSPRVIKRKLCMYAISFYVGPLTQEMTCAAGTFMWPLKIYWGEKYQECVQWYNIL